MNSLLDVARHLGQDPGGIASAPGILLRVTVLLLMATGIGLFLRRASAALRHLVWTFALVGTLLIPPLSWALPGWQWAILPQAQPSPPEVLLPPVPSSGMNMGEPSEGLPVPPNAARPSADEFPTGAEKATPSAPPSEPTAAPSAWSWPMLLALGWGLGASFGLVWLGAGLWGAREVARRATPVTDPGWLRILPLLLRASGLRRPVEIRHCLQVSVPMTWGLRRPVILVPAGSEAWSEATKQSVLLHELGHIRRGDCWTNLVGRLACVVYWFHPLVWLAARQLRRASEQAADDVVLSSDVAPPDYAEHLLAIAAQMRGLDLLGPVALPMATPSDLEGRVLAILDPQRNRRNLQRKTCCVLTFVAALLLIPCSLLRLGHAQSGRDDASAAESSLSEDSPADIPPERFPEAVALAVRNQLESRHIPFVDKDRLDAIADDYRQFVRQQMPEDLSAERREAILEAIRRQGADCLGIGDFSADSPRSMNQVYLNLPDALKSLKWQLWMALRRGPLTDNDREQLAAQRNWMRRIIEELPEDQFWKRQKELEKLEARFADPLCAPLDRPMSEDQFAKFRESIEKYLEEAASGVDESTDASQRQITPHNPLPFVNHHFVRAALACQWEGEKGASLFPRFDDDAICGWFIGGLYMHLSFESNRDHKGNNPGLEDFAQGDSVMDAATGYPVRIPNAAREPREFSAWLEKEGRGDFGYDTADGAGLFAVRGARLLPLDVKTWCEADAIANSDLRRRIETSGRDRVSLDSAYLKYREELTTVPREYVGPYVGVLTKEGRLAVVHVEDFSTLQSIGVHTRVRAPEQAGGTDAKSSPRPTDSPALLTAFGTVVDPASKPVAGVKVYLREWSTYRISQEPYDQNLNDILAETQTDAQGAFRFENVPAKPLIDQWLKDTPWDVVVVAKPYAIAWQHLAAAQAANPMKFTLATEAKITGRVTDQQGRTIPDAEVRIGQIQSLAGEQMPPLAHPDTFDLQLSRLAPVAKTDVEGKVTISGLPPETLLAVQITHGDFRTDFLYVATTDQPQPNMEVVEFVQGKRTRRPKPVYSEAFSVALEPPFPRIVGRIVTADSKQPLPKVRVDLVGWLGTLTDQDGRFVIQEVRGVSPRLLVFAPKDGQHLGRLVHVALANDQRDTPVEVELTRGEPLSGVVADETTGNGVAGVNVEYETGFDINTATTDGPLPSGEKTDIAGRFRLVVPPGKGQVRVVGPVKGYDLPKPHYRGPKAEEDEDDAEFARSVEVIAGQPTDEIKFTVRRHGAAQSRPTAPPEKPQSPAGRRTVEGVVLDPEGRPVAGAEVGPSLWFRGIDREPQPVRTDREGRFSFRSTPLMDRDRVVIAVDKERKLRGHVLVPEHELTDPSAAPLEIRLVATGMVTGRVMDGDKPVRGAGVQFNEYVSIQPSAPLVVTNADWAKTDENGRFQFPFVEADREFSLYANVEGYTDDQCQGRVEVGQTLELEPFSVMTLDKFVAGIVVDPGGKPVAGATVEADMMLDPDGKPVAWTAANAHMLSNRPILGAFTKQPTGKDGCFVIRGVPNVPLRLTAYIKPREGTIRSPSRVGAEPGQIDVEIVLDTKSAQEGK